MADNSRKLELLLAHTNAELNRADAKFRNVGTINSLMIGAFVAIILFAEKYGTGSDAILSEAHKITLIALGAFFLSLNVISIIVGIYGVWPRKKYAHTAYDLRYIAKGKLIKEENFTDKFTVASIKQMIRINAISIKKKRGLIQISMFLTIFPFSIIILYVIKKQDIKLREKMILRKEDEKQRKKSKK